MSSEIILHTGETDKSKSEVDIFIDDLQTVVDIIGRRPRMQTILELNEVLILGSPEGTIINKPIQEYFRHLPSFDNATRIALLERLIRVDDRTLFELTPEEMVEEMKRRGARHIVDNQFVLRVKGNPPLQWEGGYTHGERLTLSTPTKVLGVQYLFAVDRINEGTQFHESLQIRHVFAPR